MSGSVYEAALCYQPECDCCRYASPRIAELEAVIAPLLDHYIAAYDGGMDVLAIKAAALVPDWKQRVEE